MKKEKSPMQIWYAQLKLDPEKFAIWKKKQNEYQKNYVNPNPQKKMDPEKARMYAQRKAKAFKEQGLTVRGTEKTSKYIRELGMPMEEFCQKHKTYTNNVTYWRKKAPDLTFEQWQERRKKKSNKLRLRGRWEQLTGKSSPEWARLIGVSREAMRRRLDKILASPDSEQIFGKMKDTGVYDYWSIHTKTRLSKNLKATGMTLQLMIKYYDTSEGNVIHWRLKAPELSFEQWEATENRLHNPLDSVFA